MNAQFQIPKQRGDFTGTNQAAGAALHIPQSIPEEVLPTVEDPYQQLQGPEDYPTYAQVTSFLYTVGDWLAFNRKEIKDHGWTFEVADGR